MGEELFEKYGDDYFVIGTDFYKTECNLPGKNGKRILKSSSDRGGALFALKGAKGGNTLETENQLAKIKSLNQRVAYLKYFKYLIQAVTPLIAHTTPADHQIPISPNPRYEHIRIGIVKRPITSTIPLNREKKASPTPFRMPRTT